MMAINWETSLDNLITVKKHNDIFTHRRKNV